MDSIEALELFGEYIKENTPETIHNKRMHLEPLIYDILKIKYYTIFDKFWNENSIPKNSNKAIVLVERRIHENLAFILRNMFYFARYWSIVVICSDINYNYLKSICGNNNVKLLQLFEGNPDRDKGRKEYNDLLKSLEFYEMLPYEHLFFVEMDTYLRKPIDESMFEYDYVAAPYNWDFSSAGGGMSYRKKSVMIDICKRFTSTTPMQDCFANEGIKALGYKMPNYLDGMKYICESCFCVDPMGVHQWWTFFTKNIEHKEIIFHNYLKMEIIEEIKK